MPEVERVLGDLDRRDEVTVESEEVGATVSELITCFEGSTQVSRVDGIKE